MKKTAIFLTTAVMAIATMLLPEISISALAEGIHRCISSIVPALFPYLVFSNLCISLGYADILSKRLSPIATRIFHLPAAASPALVLGSISGFPIGAVTVVKQYKRGFLSKADAEQTLLFCSNAGPAFAIGTFGKLLFNSQLAGVTLWLIHFISAVLVGYFFRPLAAPKLTRNMPVHAPPGSLLAALAESISAAGVSMFGICVNIIFFTTLSKYLLAVIPSYHHENIAVSILLGFIELTNCLLSLDCCSSQAAFVIASALLAWNGLCIHSQVLSVAAGTDLSFKRYFFGKTMHILLSTTLACLIAPALFASHRQTAYSPKILITAISFIICSVIFIAVKTSSGKKA